MSAKLPAVVTAITDFSQGAQYTSLDAEAIRIVSIGVKRVLKVTVNITIPANAVASDRVSVYNNQNRYFVIRKIKTAYTNNIKLHLICDNNESIIEFNQSIDLVNEFGYTLYGSTVEAWIELNSPPTSEIVIPLDFYGIETAGKVQTPVA